MLSEQRHISLRLNWRLKGDDALKATVTKCFKQTNWAAICARASQANNGQLCEALPHYSHGGNSLARLIHFEDGTLWIVRIPLKGSTQLTSQKLRREIDTMYLLQACAKSSTPQVFTFCLNDENPAGTAFTMLEFLPGNTAMDEARHYHTDGGMIPRHFKQALHRSMAVAHVQIASARLPKIGSVLREKDGSFTLGPIPNIGGPFDDAASFIQAWAANIKFPYPEEYVRKLVPNNWIDEVLKGIMDFPDQIAALATSEKYFIREGPFPVRHPDLSDNNIAVTKEFDLLGVMDWEDAYTVPWELIDCPLFIRKIPRLLNPPSQYDGEGWPKDADEAGIWVDEREYVRLVQEAEEHAGVDHRLSDILGNNDAQDLAVIIHLFSEGEMGLYGRALQHFETK